MSPLALAAALLAVAVALCAFAPCSAHAENAYGTLCSKYESGHDPGEIDPNCAYGAYQMDAYNAHLFAEYLAKKKATSANWGKALVAAYKKDGSSCGAFFDVTWRHEAGRSLSKSQKKKLKKVAKAAGLSSVAAGSKSAFMHQQYLYVKKAYYKAAVKLWKKAAPGFKTKNYTWALRNVIFSTAVQHGPYGATHYIFEPALKAIGGWKKGMAESKLINAIYDERSRTASKRVSSIAKGATINKISKTDATAKKYGIAGKYLVHFYSSPSAVQIGVYVRLGVNERSDALKMLTRQLQASCKHAKTTGGTVEKYFSITDKEHKEKVSALVCTKCGKTLAKAFTRTVTNEYVYSGAKHKDVSGHAYTVHSKRWYRAKCKLKVRSSASTKGKVRATLAKKDIVKVRGSRMGADGFWWVKVKVKKKSGYVRACKLSPLGTASSVHKMKGGACVYCGATAAQLAMNKAGTYKLRVNSKARAAAYPHAKAKAKLAKGTKVTVTKVVNNGLNDWWGKLDSGGYVKMTLLKA